MCTLQLCTSKQHSCFLPDVFWQFAINVPNTTELAHRRYGTVVTYTVEENSALNMLSQSKSSSCCYVISCPPSGHHWKYITPHPHQFTKHLPQFFQVCYIHFYGSCNVVKYIFQKLSFFFSLHIPQIQGPYQM